MGGDVVYYDKMLTTKLKSGSLYIFPANLPYKMVNNVDDTLQCDYLHMGFSPGQLKQREENYFSALSKM